MHPLINPSSLTDEQIRDKLKKCYEYLQMQESLGHNDTVTSISNIIDILEFERDERLEKELSETFEEPEDGELVALGEVDEMSFDESLEQIYHFGKVNFEDTDNDEDQ